MEKHLQAADYFAQLLDNKFQIFGVRFGINALLEIIPELGDFLAAVLSLYIVWIAVKMRVPSTKIAVMLWNITVNFLLGIIPIVGEVTYIFRKANLKNLAILKEFASNSQVIDGEIVHAAV